MKRTVLAVLLALLLLPAAALADTRLMVVSDLHYLAPALYRGSGFFLETLRKGDGKVTQYGEELLSALYQEILTQRPDALVVTGDLTYNGEKESHAALAAWFRTVEEAGVPVWVIPGNHDINTGTPVGFTANGYERTRAVTPSEFAEIYADFLMPGTAGFSYAVPVSDELWLMMTDVALYRERAWTPGMFTADHAAWLEGALREAADAAAVTATHHSLIQHTAFSPESYLMYGSEDMRELLSRYGVSLNLSGHLHIQHIAREHGLADAALGAFCIWPHRYATVTLSGQTLTYEACSLNASYLPDGFLETSRQWFMECAEEKVKAQSLQGTEAEIESMAEYAARFNLAYFSGTYDPRDGAWTREAAYALWEKQEDSFFWKYLRLVMHEANGENLRITRTRTNNTNMDPK